MKVGADQIPIAVTLKMGAGSEREHLAAMLYTKDHSLRLARNVRAMNIMMVELVGLTTGVIQVYLISIVKSQFV